jgi:hypothetical protein
VIEAPHLLVAARPVRAGQQPNPPAGLVLGVLACAGHGRAVHDIRQTWGLNHGQAVDAIRAAVRRHPDHPVAREWARLLRITARRLSVPDPVRHPTHASDDPNGLDLAVDVAVEADYRRRGEGR